MPIKMLMEVHDKGEVLTGVFYVDTQKPDFATLLNMVDEPLATLPQVADASRPRGSDCDHGSAFIGLRKRRPCRIPRTVASYLRRMSLDDLFDAFSIGVQLVTRLFARLVDCTSSSSC